MEDNRTTLTEKMVKGMQVALADIAKSKSGEISELYLKKAISGNRVYLEQYPALIELAQRTPDTAHGMMGLSLSIYGWMPTILKAQDFKIFGTGDFAASKVRAVKTHQAAQFIEGIVKAPVNNSWVGTSKVLHMLNPDVFPIWDSRIAGLLGPNYAAAMASRDRFLAYVEASHTVLDEPHPLVDAAMVSLTKTTEINWTSVRSLEFLLFSRTIKDIDNWPVVRG